MITGVENGPVASGDGKAVAAIAKQMRSTGSAPLQALQEPAIRVLLYTERLQPMLRGVVTTKMVVTR